MSEGDVVNLYRELDNSHDKNAIRVSNRMGVLGYINRDDASWIAKIIDAKRPVEACIMSISTGDSGMYGVILELSTDDDCDDSTGKVKVEGEDHKKSAAGVSVNNGSDIPFYFMIGLTIVLIFTLLL